MLEKKPKTPPGTPTSASTTGSANSPGSSTVQAAAQDDGATVLPPSIHNRSSTSQARAEVIDVPAEAPVDSPGKARKSSTGRKPRARPAEPIKPAAVHVPAAQVPPPRVPPGHPRPDAPSAAQSGPGQLPQARVTLLPTPGETASEPGRAGRDLPVAIAVGVGLGVAIVVSLIVYRPAFLAIVLAAVVISVWELTRALRTARVRPPLPPLMLGAVAMIVVTWLSGEGGLAVTTMLTVLAAIVWRLSDGPVGYFRDASTAVLITMYVPLLACFAVLMLRPDDGAARIVTFIVVVVCSDVGGYVAGALFGKHPMSPTVSPKKSWEGLGGSVLACMIGGMLLVVLALDGAWWQGLLYGAAIAVTATVGDLGESIVKRDLGLKDMSTLLPGHGGLMDRMDSLLPSAAVAYLLLSAFLPSP